MNEPGSLSVQLERLKAGESAALRPLWERYFARLVELAHRQLHGRAHGGADAEDVVLSAFDSLHRGVGQGRFPRLEDRDDLWQVLLLLLRQKAINLMQHESRQKRGGGRVRRFSEMEAPQTDPTAGAFADCFGPDPSPDFAAEVAEECRKLLDALGDEQLKTIAVSKMEGYSNEEIAARLGCSLATVERRLGLIRKIWSRMAPGL